MGPRDGRSPRRTPATEAEITALEAEEAQLQEKLEKEAARAKEEAERRASEATATAMGKAERKDKRETPPTGFRVETLRMLFEGDPSSRMKIDLDAEESRSCEGSGRINRHRRKGKGKTPERARRPIDNHPHDCYAFVTCSDRDR